MGHTSGLMHRKQGLTLLAGVGVAVERSQSVIATIVTKRFKASGEADFHPKLPAILFANHAAPCRQAVGRMLLHPLGELRRAHQAGLHRDVSEVRGGDGLLVATMSSRHSRRIGPIRRSA